MITPPVPLKNLLAELTTDEDKMVACEDYIFTENYDPRMKVLRDALHNPSKKTRERAVELLGRIHTIESINILSEYSQHEKDFECRLEAVRALTEMGNSVPQFVRVLAKELIPWISTEYTNGYTDMSGIASYCLRNFGDLSKNELIDVLTSKRSPIKCVDYFDVEKEIPNSQDDHLKLAAINVLMGMKIINIASWFDQAFEATLNVSIHEALIGLAGYFEEKSLVPRLIKMLQDHDYKELHPAIAEALGDIGDSRAINPLIQALKRGYWEGDVKLAAASALEVFANRSKVRDALASELSFDSTDVSEKVAEILFAYEDKRSVEYMLLSETVEEEWAIDSVISALNTYVDHDCEDYEYYIWIRDNAVASLAALGGEKALNALVDKIESEGPDESLVNAILDCGEIGVNALNKLVTNQNFCEEMVSILVNTSSRSVIPCLEWALTINNKKVKADVKKALARFKIKKVGKRND